MPVAIIEDDDGMRDSLVIMLAVHGFPNHAYASAEAFLGDADREKNGLLLVDQQLPGMSGLELIRRLAAQGKLPPTILVSARLNPDLAERARAAGARATLEKPVEPADLMAVLRNCVPHSPARD